ncbi:GntR family transcriptional regulator [Spongisporangium articulatum]|uniref:GntR family transcriptional regulator n=1 Tax=Spongisporangium articulatum TaxID=3362603 RepID=A0ABW8AJK4_9ACTN
MAPDIDGFEDEPDGDELDDLDGAHGLDRSSPMPLWAQLQQDLTRRLGSGEFDNGFPGELELVEAYGVSRYTVREALRRLRESRLIDSAKGRGSWVRRGGDNNPPLGSLYSLFYEVDAKGIQQRSVVVSQERVTSALAARELGLPEDTEFFYLERVRLADEQPMAHDQTWIPASVAAPLLDVDFAVSGLYDELAARCGVSLAGGRERISAVLPSDADRKLLEVPDDIACFEIRRVSTVEARRLEFRLTVVRGDRYSVLADWSPQGYTVSAEPLPGAPTEG